MTSSKTIISIVISLFLIFSYLCVYTVNEGQQALLLRLGAIVIDSHTGKPYIKGPGLHVKAPFITQIQLFDTRLQTMDIKSSRIVTAEQKDVIVDYYVKWRINDLALFYTRIGSDPRLAGVILEQQLNDSLRAQFGKRTISEAVSDDRASIMDTLSQQAGTNAKRLGLDVIDVRIKRIDLPTEGSAAVFERMRAERERVATEHRSVGKASAEGIRANADANATITVATAKEQAAVTRSLGDALAAKIYAEAYNQDPSFYAFYRSLIAYKKAFENKTENILVLKPDSQFFKYFNSDQGLATAKSTK